MRIAAKDLGYLAMPDFCARCFYVKTHARLPYQIFPGIFSSIDSYSKKVTHEHYRKYGKLPEWLQGLEGEPIAIPSKDAYSTDVDGVTLFGIPDDIFKGKSLIIVDYKTARFTARADSLLPMYTVQLNAYAYIAEKIGLGHVSRLVLVYYEPSADVAHDEIHHDGFHMKFTPHCLEITKDYSILHPLLKKVKENYALTEAPDAREGCTDCEKVRHLVSLSEMKVEK